MLTVGVWYDNDMVVFVKKVLYLPVGMLVCISVLEFSKMTMS